MFHEYSYEVVSKIHEERRTKALLRRQLLESTSDGYIKYQSHDAEVVEIAFRFDCDHSEPIGA